MSNASKAIFAIVLVGGLSARGLSATKVAVGPSTCQPSLVHFSTIQAAVNAVPFNTTILVCPGNYPEQVVITQPLTLQGVTDGTGNAAVINVPATGLVVNAPSNVWGPSTAQLLVEYTVGVTVSDITVDGTGSGCVSGAGRTMGIEFYNVGIPVDGTAAGKIQNVVVRNQIDGCGSLSGEGGEGIVSDNSYITIASNEVHDIGRSGIFTNVGATNINSNNLQNVQNGIVTNNSTAQTVISLNTVANLKSLEGYTSIGLWVGGGSATLSRNTVATSSTFSYGIYSGGSGAGTMVSLNKVSAVNYGLILDVCSGTIAQGNTVTNTYNTALYDDFSGGGNIMNKNTVNESPDGVFSFSVGGDILVPNALNNVAITLDPSEPSLGTNSAN